MEATDIQKLVKDIQYVLDRFEIQDKIALYALGQDNHQPGAPNKNVLEEWSQIFTIDAQIDCRDVGLSIFNLQDYAELMRGKELKGGGLETSFKVWAHLEHQTKVTIDGDHADTISLHLHSHETIDGNGNTFAVGYWYDAWIRTTDGWRITERKLKQLYFNTFQNISNPKLLALDI